MYVIKMENISKSFNNRKILNDIDFTLEKNGIAIINGYSGAGKSTFLNILLGFVKAEKGRVTILGEDISDLSEYDMAKLRLDKIGYMTQEDTILSSLSLYDNINIPAYISGKESKINIKDYIEKFNLAEIESSKKDVLSGGEKRKLMFIRSLANMPEILILDEPTSSLDSDSVEMLIDEIKKLSKKMSILIVTHDERITDIGKNYKLKDGNLTIF